MHLFYGIAGKTIEHKPRFRLLRFPPQTQSGGQLNLCPPALSFILYNILNNHMSNLPPNNIICCGLLILSVCYTDIADCLYRSFLKVNLVLLLF